jgi:hypothetical protein
VAAAQFGHGVLAGAFPEGQAHSVGDVHPCLFDGPGADAFCGGLCFVAGAAVEGEANAAFFGDGELGAKHDNVFHAQGQVAVWVGCGFVVHVCKFTFNVLRMKARFQTKGKQTFIFLLDNGL